MVFPHQLNADVAPAVLDVVIENSGGEASWCSTPRDGMVAEWNLATDGLRVVLESLPRVTLLKHGGYLGTKIFSFFRSMLTVFSKPLPLFFRPQILIH